MAGRGSRVDLTSLAGGVGVNSPVSQQPKRPSGPATSAPLNQLASNPRNPREDLGDLSDLASIAERQLQPVLVVTRKAYLALFPDDAELVGDARWVVVTGNRRLAAAREYGCSSLEFVVKDDVAGDKVTFLTAAIDENIGRRDFDVLEEARAVDQLARECGSADGAAAQLKRSKGWVSQRRALLQLAPELQAALRAGDLAVRLARSLARVPLAEQVDAWQAQQDRDAKKQDSDAAPKSPPLPRPASAPGIAKALRRFEPEPVALAQALRDYLPPAMLSDLVAELRNH
ncbi:ParB/RepB/Spo0J family partition protein [Nocardia brasiliensis]|uniref:ParB/RepB/Spo0J family partition protein n=1 Tax=Nocardia brasiliensis TaxID=37326 RepID=UPI00189342B2|nr:ParB N-terminal domain-containing protein [Nocardia brasiliensis]MBF6548861.1 ParB N-terminal domain-containing protein [Nocardia brasiliensis]